MIGAAGEPALRFEAVTAADRGGERVERLSFEVAPGEIVAVLGPEGAGGTVALRLAAGLLAPESGSVRALGADLASLSRYDLLRWRSRVVYVHDSPIFLNNLRMLDNLHLPLRYHSTRPEEEIASAVREALRDCGVDEWGIDMKAYPADADRPLQKRASIARALALDPEVLLLDRPEWALPGHHHGFLIPLLRRLRERRRPAVLLATESLRLACAASHRVLLLHKGAILAQGEPDAVRKAGASLGEAWTALVAHDPYGTSEEVVP